jgi:tetratricopeptide (TPR) repeat protein
MSGSQGRPGRRAPRPGGATANGSLYERYKDALRRGHVAALRGRNEAAVDAYGEAAAIAPDRALPHASIGGILVKMDRLEDATAAYERAIALAPRDEGALRGLADVHLRTGRRTEAATMLDRLADTLDGAGRLADATDAARRALELGESTARRAQVEGFATRLRAASTGDEAAQRALEQALRVLEPAPPDEIATTEADESSGPGLSTDEAEPPEIVAEEAEASGVDVGVGEAQPAAEAMAGGEPTAVEPAFAEPSTEATAEAPADEPEPVPVPEPIGLGIALGAAAEAALHAGEFESAHDGLLAAARAHRRAGRLSAAVDACYLAIGLAPSDPDLHLLLAELYLDRGWRGQAIDKLLLLGRLADLDDDAVVRERLCTLVTTRLADEPRVAVLCA